jgi:hypothetical protein
MFQFDIVYECDQYESSILFDYLAISVSCHFCSVGCILNKDGNKGVQDILVSAYHGGWNW